MSDDAYVSQQNWLILFSGNHFDACLEQSHNLNQCWNIVN